MKSKNETVQSTWKKCQATRTKRRTKAETHTHISNKDINLQLSLRLETWRITLLHIKVCILYCQTRIVYSISISQTLTTYLFTKIFIVMTLVLLPLKFTKPQMDVSDQIVMLSIINKWGDYRGKIVKLSAALSAVNPFNKALSSITQHTQISNCIK